MQSFALASFFLLSMKPKRRGLESQDLEADMEEYLVLRVSCLFLNQTSFQVSHQVGRKARLNAALQKLFSSKKTRGKRALASQLCRVRASASSGRREESKEALDSLVANRYTQ